MPYIFLILINLALVMLAVVSGGLLLSSKQQSTLNFRSRLEAVNVPWLIRKVKLKDKFHAITESDQELLIQRKIACVRHSVI